ncbi:AAA family ATPase [Sulfuricurvum sp.]|uniref:AAA family ATPase n=1 Tax=Sulfuricurvum sp. TaxID=2025608 RepID=UPI002D6B1658|nr:AAA family ATPase [Sulfuricurvum sp.]HZF69390.1 AAA family ATPase [Sulfuricurvum sp.]
MLEEIVLKNIATYDTTGTSLLNLKKINFIYGSNGSGKTTVSNFISNPTDNKYKNCSLRWIAGQPIETMVYNKEFKEKNFNSTNIIKGIFTLGNATATDIQLINKKKEDLKVINDEGIKLKGSLEKLNGTDNTEGDIQKVENDFKEYCWKNIYKEYEYFKEAFAGSMQKQTFKDKLLNEFHNNKADKLTIEELKEKSETIFGEVPQPLDHISNIEYLEISQIEDDAIWNEKIIGKSDVNIAKLIQRLNLNDWVNQGKGFIQDDNICPFCQQETITTDFRLQLENYFDTTFIESIEKIKSFKQKYDLLSENLINQLNQIEIVHKNIKNTKLDIDKFSIFLKTLSSQINSNKEILNSKIKEPSRSLELVSTKEQLTNFESIISKANEEIKKHNQIVENYKTEKNNLINLIWNFLVNTFESDIIEYIKQIDGLQKGINKLTEAYKAKRKEWSDLNREIKELDKNVTSVQPTIDEINNLLKFYGFLNFEIVPSELDKNQYQIQREDGSLAQETLSEGEITFITFLYYYQLTKGSTNQDNVSTDRVLVIDDPISSLDSNVLFIVSTLIKNILDDIRANKGNIKQLIILTHNVYFHKEVSFINSRDTGVRNDTHFWILRKNNKVSHFYPYEKNPIQTSYQLLWRELKDKEKSSMITIQNTMRRIIENYFKILGNYSDETLITKFKNYEDQIICRSLISWINDGSHSVSDDLYIEAQEDLIENYLNVFKKIFEYTDHEGHYNMMMGIVEETNAV